MDIRRDIARPLFRIVLLHKQVVELGHLVDIEKLTPSRCSPWNGYGVSAMLVGKWIFHIQHVATSDAFIPNHTAYPKIDASCGIRNSANAFLAALHTIHHALIPFHEQWFVNFESSDVFFAKNLLERVQTTLITLGSAISILLLQIINNFLPHR